MKAFKGFKSEAKGKSYEQLPAGPYIAKIKAAKVDGREPNQSLVLRLDIAEGEYEGYYAKRYMHDAKNEKAMYPAKYKGDFKVRIPDENSPYYESNLRKFNDAMWRIEQSNPGYHWDWQEDGLRGLTVGVSVQQGSYNGSQFTRIARLEVADDVRQGIVQTMAPAAPRSDAEEPYSPPVDQQTGFSKVDTDELPF